MRVDPAYINLKVKQQVSTSPRIIIAAALTHKAFQDGWSNYSFPNQAQHAFCIVIFNTILRSLWRVFVISVAKRALSQAGLEVLADASQL